MGKRLALAMAGAASAHQAAATSRQGNGQERAGRARRSSADPQRARRGATAVNTEAPAALNHLSRLRQFADASPRVAQLRWLKALAAGQSAPVAQLAGDPEEEELVQGKFATAALQPQLQQAPRANNTGLPDQLKSGIESLSGMSMDHVRVHYNSAQPVQLNALAYAQGSDIHLAPGQERHLPHEAWHVVQQAQGRVRPTLQLQDGVPVNDDAGLEREADEMGTRANSLGVNSTLPKRDGDTKSCYEEGIKVKTANISLVRQRVTEDPIDSVALDADVEKVKTDVNTAMTKLQSMILNNNEYLGKLAVNGRDRRIYAPIQSLWKNMSQLLRSWDASWSVEDTCGLMLDIGLKLGRLVDSTTKYKMTEIMQTSRREDGVQGSDWEQNFIPSGTRTQSGVSATTIHLLKTLSLESSITAEEIEAVMNGVCMYWNHSLIKKITHKYHTTAEVWATYNKFLMGDEEEMLEK